MGYDNIMNYVVLTDYPEDFTEFAEQTGKIKAIIDINKAREPYPWSPELEHIPSASTDEKEYGKQYVKNMSQGKMFSYSLHRFSFPTIAELGYNKIVFQWKLSNRYRNFGCNNGYNKLYRNLFSNRWIL